MNTIPTLEDLVRDSLSTSRPVFQRADPILDRIHPNVRNPYRRGPLGYFEALELDIDRLSPEQKLEMGAFTPLDIQSNRVFFSRRMEAQYDDLTRRLKEFERKDEKLNIGRLDRDRGTE